MPQPFQSVLLHALPDNQGWQIIGIKMNREREIIATLALVTSEWLTEQWADMAAKNLDGQPTAEVD